MGFPPCHAESISHSQNWQPVAVFKPTVILLFTNFLTEYFFFAVKGIINSYLMRLSMTALKISIYYFSHHTEAEFKNCCIIHSKFF